MGISQTPDCWIGCGSIGAYEVTIKVGRFRNPLFMYSDFLDVGYAYHWISPPDSVYDLSGFDSSDGVTMEYQTELAGFTSTATVAIARTKADLGDIGFLDSTNAWTVAWTLNRDWFTIHAVHSESDVTSRIDAFTQLSEGLSSFGVSQSNIDKMVMEKDTGAFDGIGIGIDTGTFFAVTEYTETSTTDSFAADPAKSWYVSAGVRFGDWTAYATVENKDADANTDDRDAILAEVDQGVAGFQSNQTNIAGLIAAIQASGGSFNPGGPTTYTYADIPALQSSYGLLDLALTSADALKAGVTAIFNQTARDEDVYSVGMRYNFHPSAALKFEYSQMDDHLTDLKPAAVAIAVDIVY